MCKFLGVGGRRKGAGEYKKGDPHENGQRPLVTLLPDDQQSPSGRPWPVAGAHQPRTAAWTDKRGGSFLYFLDSFFINFFKALACSKGLGFLGGGVGCTTFHFLKHAPTLGSANMESGDFTFSIKKYS
jgi:hypothetical protein